MFWTLNHSRSFAGFQSDKDPATRTFIGGLSSRRGSALTQITQDDNEDALMFVVDDLVTFSLVSQHHGAAAAGTLSHAASQLASIAAN